MLQLLCRHGDKLNHSLIIARIAKRHVTLSFTLIRSQKPFCLSILEYTISISYVGVSVEYVPFAIKCPLSVLYVATRYDAILCECQVPLLLLPRKGESIHFVYYIYNTCAQRKKNPAVTPSGKKQLKSKAD